MKLNLGCGPNKLDGYVGCDIIKHPGVDYICSVDALPFDDETVSEILCEHIIEHLTFEQFNKAVIEWFRVLIPGGKLVIECPDLQGLCEQFLHANEFGRFHSYKGYWALVQHLYGHQRGNSQDEKFSQVHKSGYTVEHLRFVLSGVGFGGFEELKPRHGVPGTAVLRLSAKRVVKQAHTIYPEIN